MPAFNLESLDDPIVFDACESFAGGQVSFSRPSLLQQSEAALLENVVLYQTGELRTRRGTRGVGGEFVNGGTGRIQGLAYLDTFDSDKQIAFTDGLARWLNGDVWETLFDADIADHAANVDAVQLGDMLYYVGGYEGGIKRWNGFDLDVVQGRVTVITVTNGGSGYVSAPSVLISGGGGASATAIAILTDDVVTEIQVTDGGDNYTSAPSVSFTGGGGGSGATATAAISTYPEGATGLARHGTRLVAWGYEDVPDAVDFSDLLDGNRWNLVTQRLRIGGGDGDPVIGVVSWLDVGLLVLKRHSAWIVDANPQTDVAEWTVRLIHGRIGCVARRTIIQVGQDILFLSDFGVQSVRKQLATSNNEIPVAISQPVQDIIEDIEWTHAAKSCACFDANFYLIAIPVDDDEPDTILAFHYLTGGWTVFKDVRAIAMFPQPFEGRSRLLLGTPDGEVREWLNYLSEDSSDEDLYLDGEEEMELESRLVTRAINFNEPVSPKSGFYAEIELARTNCKIDLFAIRDGADPEPIFSTTLAAGALPFPVAFLTPFPKRTHVRRRVNLQRLSPFRELQFELRCSRGPMNLRRIIAAAFIDTLELKDQP